MPAAGDAMETLDSLLDGAVAPGIYRLAGGGSSSALVQGVARWGWQGWRLNGATIEDKTTFLEACARAMHFPGYFGRNWDAFEESITDLSWWPAAGYLLIYETPYPFARRAPRDWRIALGILGDAARDWQARGRPFYTLLRRTYGAAPGVPLLPYGITQQASGAIRRPGMVD
jgi:hypothetical protein